MPSTSDLYPLDAAEAAFVAQLRAEGLVPSSVSFPDAVFITDANAICQLMALGEEFNIQKVDLANMRENRESGYGISSAQAADVMVLSAQTYCPEQVAVIKNALA